LAWRALKRWKNSMQAAGKKLTSWLHKDAVTLPSELIYQQSDGSQQIAAASSSGALDTVADFWHTIWDRDVACDALDENVSQHDILHAPMTGSWQINPAELARLAHDNQGAAGPDGWTSEEAACLPVKAWEVFLELWSRWVSRGVFPEVRRHSRMVLIPKVAVSTCLDVAQLRPISVQPLFVRLLSSVFDQRSQSKQWICQVIPRSLHGCIKGRGIHTALLPLETAFARGGILVSLDMKKAFDTSVPSSGWHACAMGESTCLGLGWSRSWDPLVSTFSL
jgi:hypothetical protein